MRRRAGSPFLRQWPAALVRWSDALRCPPWYRFDGKSAGRMSRRTRMAGGFAPPAFGYAVVLPVLELEPDLQHHDAVVVVAETRSPADVIRRGGCAEAGRARRQTRLVERAVGVELVVHHREVARVRIRHRVLPAV